MEQIEGGIFVERNPVTGTPGTPVSAEWLQAVQDELVDAIEKAELPLDDTARLGQAINILAGSVLTSRMTDSLTAGGSDKAASAEAVRVLNASLATVAKSGNYNDLSNRPSYARSGTYDGYCELPDGLIIQHFQAVTYGLSSGSSSTREWSYPAAFPNHALTATFSLQANDFLSSYPAFFMDVEILELHRSKVTYRYKNNSAVNTKFNQYLHFIVMGY